MMSCTFKADAPEAIHTPKPHPCARVVALSAQRGTSYVAPNVGRQSWPAAADGLLDFSHAAVAVLCAGYPLRGLTEAL